MKLFTRFLALMLAVLMLAGVVACAETNEGNGDDNNTTTAGEAVTEAETKDPNYTDDIPADYSGKGATIKIVGLEKEGVSDELKADTLNGELINDAVYERNKNVENRLDVKLDISLVDQPHTSLDNAVKGGDATFCDVVSNSTMYAIQYVQKGDYLNLTNDDSFVDPTKYYWSQGYNDIASYGAGSEQKQYLVTGALAISLFRYMFVTIYNKTEFKNKGIDDLYETVLNGEWTLEAQEQILKDRHKSATGDESKNNEEDFYGFITGNIVSVDPYCVAANVEFVSKNDAGEWEYNVTSDVLDRADQLQTILNRIYNNDNGTYVFDGAEKDDTGKTSIAEMFTKGQGLMATVQLYALETTISNADFDYGLVPIPKLSASQANYSSYVQDQVTSYGIASTVSDDKYQLVSAFLEAGAKESYEKVVDAYYNKAIYKYLQDPDSVKMLDIIYNSIKFDFCGAYSNVITGYVIRDQLRPIFSGSGKKALSSTMTSRKKTVEKFITKFNKAMSEIKY